MTERFELAVDPGNEGGAWLGRVDPEGHAETLFAWHWKPGRRQGRPVLKLLTAERVEHGDGRSTFALVDDVHADHHAIGTAIRSSALTVARGGWRLTVEGLFGRGSTLERLAWYAGLVAGPLLAGTVGAVERPLAIHWRGRLLGLGPRTPADVCDQRVAAWAVAHSDIPPALQNSHTVDAVALAAWRAKDDNG